MSEILQRKDALTLGRDRYFTGRECKHGHTAERNAITGKCLECRFPSALNHREYNARWKARHPGREQEVKYRFRYGVELSALPPKPSKCDLCGRGHRKIVLDHSHKDGRFRGWLCDACNSSLGQMDENPALIRMLADYVEKHSARTDAGIFVTRNGQGKGLHVERHKTPPKRRPGRPYKTIDGQPLSA